MYAWLRRKKIRNEMDLLELGVRKRSNAFKLMAAIRDTDMEHWSKIDEAGCVMLGVFVCTGALYRQSCWALLMAVWI